MVKLLSSTRSGNSEAVINSSVNLPGDIEGVEIPFGSELFVRLNFKTIPNEDGKLALIKAEEKILIVDAINVDSITGAAFELPLPTIEEGGKWSLSVTIYSIATKDPKFTPRCLIYSFIKRVEE